MTCNYNPNPSNEEINKFILMLVICLIALFCSLMCGCRSHESVVISNTHEKSDTTAVTSQVKDSTSHVTIRQDSVLQSLQEKERTHEYHKSYTDTLHKTFVDHYEKTSDSVDVKIDSLGNITYYYFKRTYERDMVYDTIRITNVKVDSVYMDRELIDRLHESNSLIDSLHHELLSRDSTYRAVRDSIDNNSEIVVTKKEPWWEQARKSIVAMCIGGAIVAILGVAAMIFLKVKK